MTQFIPIAVLDLLSSEWLDKTACTATIAEKCHPTSMYVIRPDNGSTFSFAESVALHGCGAFGLGSDHREKTVIINEHASHSLQEFLGAVSIAWKAHQDRLDKYVQDLP